VSPPKREWFEVARRAGSALKHRHAYAVQIVFNSLPDTVKVFFALREAVQRSWLGQPSGRRVGSCSRYGVIIQYVRSIELTEVAI
jgi:hypothetical protein